MRKLLDRLASAAIIGCATLTALLFVGIMVTLLRRGLPAVSWSFLTSPATQAGAGGGVLYQLLGSVILIATALGVSVPPAVAVSLLRSVYLEEGPARRRIALWLNAVNGIPSILFGIFGLLVFVRTLGMGKSWLTGGILLGMMILPTISVALSERIDRLPSSYLEAAYGLGLSRSQVVWSVILPQSAGGLVSGALLGIARAAGETAPILFAAAVFSGATLPRGIVDSPVLALPYHIFVLAQDTYSPAAVANLWGAATVLLGLVLAFSLAALPARLKLHEEARRG